MVNNVGRYEKHSDGTPRDKTGNAKSKNTLV